jgi:hypothetical protein
MPEPQLTMKFAQQMSNSGVYEFYFLFLFQRYKWIPTSNWTNHMTISQGIIYN